MSRWQQGTDACQGARVLEDNEALKVRRLRGRRNFLLINKILHRNGIKGDSLNRIIKGETPGTRTRGGHTFGEPEYQREREGLVHRGCAQKFRVILDLNFCARTSP